MTVRNFWRSLVSVCILAAPVFSQRNAAFERALIVVPMVGSGTYADPRRPALLPARPSIDGTGILEWTWEPTADGKLAIVELVAVDRKAFASIVANKQVLQAFEKGKHKPQDIEAAIRRLRPDFTLDKQPGRPK